MYILKYAVDKHEFDGSLVVSNIKRGEDFYSNKYVNPIRIKLDVGGWDYGRCLKELTRVFV